jgi:hypothetical protein
LLCREASHCREEPDAARLRVIEKGVMHSDGGNMQRREGPLAAGTNPRSRGCRQLRLEESGIIVTRNNNWTRRGGGSGQLRKEELACGISPGGARQSGPTSRSGRTCIARRDSTALRRLSVRSTQSFHCCCIGASSVESFSPPSYRTTGLRSLAQIATSGVASTTLQTVLHHIRLHLALPKWCWSSLSRR